MIPLGGLLGVPLRMHFAFPVLFGAALVCGDARAVLGALFALLWHEAGHVLAARLCGARLARLELTPFGCTAEYDGAFLSPGREALTALGGPLASLAGIFVFRALPRLSMTHAALLAINLLPALPLDGGRALRAEGERGGLDGEHALGEGRGGEQLGDEREHAGGAQAVGRERGDAVGERLDAAREDGQRAAEHAGGLLGVLGGPLRALEQHVVHREGEEGVQRVAAQQQLRRQPRHQRVQQSQERQRQRVVPRRRLLHVQRAL